MDHTTPDKIITPDQISLIYRELFPSEFEFLVLYYLYTNYPSSEMQYAEIKQAIANTSRLPFIDTGKDRQVERTFKGLLRSFIERVPAKANCFILTPLAEKVVEIVTQRINNPYLKFPLKDTFERYFSLPENATQDIKALQSWFKFEFLNNARQVVLGHLDGLKLSVDDAIKTLNQVLEADNLSAIQMLEQFSHNFQALGDKARQITEAIKMKVEVHYQLRDIVDGFSDKALAITTSDTDYNIVQYNRQEAFRIKEEVETFFEKVDTQLDLINMKMAFAGTKIAELQESLRTQSRYKISLKKLLLYLLENSKTDLKGVHLPEKFPVRYWVAQKFRFRNVRYYDLGFLRKAKPFEQGADAAYEESQRNQFEQELQKQVLIQQHCEQMEKALSLTKYIDLDKKLFEIMQQEDGLELGIQTGYEFIRNLSPQNHIRIEEELNSNQNNDIHLWKTTIRSNRGSDS